MQRYIITAGYITKLLKEGTELHKGDLKNIGRVQDSSARMPCETEEDEDGDIRHQNSIFKKDLGNRVYNVYKV